MNKDNKTKNDLINKDLEEIYKKPTSRSLKPTIAGFLLITAAILSIFFSVTYITYDEDTLNRIIENNEQLQNLDQEITAKDIKNVFLVCGSLGIIISIFLLLGGILALKRKMWMFCFITSVLGLVLLFFVLPGLISIIAVIFIYLSKDEFI